jgi:hypothetical protein
MSLLERFTHIVGLVRAAIGVHLARQLRPPQPVWLGERLFVPVPPPQRCPPLPEPVWTLLWRRLGRLAERFTTLYARWQSNTLPRRRPPRPGRVPSATATPRPRLPAANGWVNHRIPESAPPSGLLDALLRQQEPELRAFLAAAPQAGRLLRPLCRALGIVQPAWLRLPARPRRPRPTPTPQAAPRWPPGQPRPRSHPSPMLPADKPLEGYVLGATGGWKNSTA